MGHGEHSHGSTPCLPYCLLPPPPSPHPSKKKDDQPVRPCSLPMRILDCMVSCHYVSPSKLVAILPQFSLPSREISIVTPAAVMFLRLIGDAIYIFMGFFSCFRPIDDNYRSDPFYRPPPTGDNRFVAFDFLV